jgi:acetyl-CoA carboxylase carboxyltransferase component
MGGEQAAGVLSTVKNSNLVTQGKPEMSPEERAEFERPVLAKYEKEGSCYYSSARLWDDGVIDPLQTRDILGLCLGVTQNEKIPDSKYGIFRM